MRRIAVFAGVMLLLCAVLAGSLDSWRDYNDLGHAGAGASVATVSGETGVSGDIEPALFPETQPVPVASRPGKVAAIHDARPLRAIYVPHDRPPAYS